MALTDAERQRAHRSRIAERLTVLEAMVADRDATIGELRGRLSAALDAQAAANDEIERLSATQCRHPAPVVSDGQCHACGADVW